MQAPSVFGYMKFSHYMRDRFHFEKQRNPAFSHRYFVRRSGIQSQSLLSMIASGRRLPSSETLHLICKGLALADRERDYLALLIEYERAQSDDVRVSLIGRIAELNPVSDSGSENLSLEQFATVSSWYHIAILEMTGLKSFQPDPEWISVRLARKITPAQADEALQRLVGLGLLIRESGVLSRPARGLQCASEVKSVAIRDYHRQVLELARQAIEGQSLDERLLTSAAFCIDARQLPEIQKALNETIRRFSRKYQRTSGADHVYQLGIQFFKLTD